MHRTSLLISLAVSTFFVACGTDDVYMGTEGHDAADGPDSSGSGGVVTGNGSGGAGGASIAAAAARLVISPTDACFAAPIGKQSGAMTFNVQNIGEATSGSLTAILGGAAAQSFVMTSNTCTAAGLAGGATCSVVVVYAPTSTRTASETSALTIGDGQASVAATLQGNDIGQVIVTPAAVDFGTVAPGKQSDEVLLSATTMLACQAPLTASLDNPSFTISTDSCTGRSLKQGETCHLGVRLAPPSSATLAPIVGQLTVAARGFSAATVSLSGSVAIVPPPASSMPLMVSPAVVSFGDVVVGQSAVATISVTNPNAEPVGALAAVLAGTGAARLSIVEDTCSAGLAPAAVCTIKIQFTSVAATDLNGTLNISDGKSTVSVELSGKGILPAATASIVASPAAVNFGEVVVGQSAMATISVVSNAAGGSGLTASLAGPGATQFSIVENGCTMSLASGGTCTVKVQFAPVAAADLTATLSVTDGQSTASVALSGKGIAAVSTQALVVSPTAIDFGGVPVGQSSATMKVTVTNRNSAPVGPVTVTSTAGTVVIVENTCSAPIPAGGSCSIGLKLTPVDTSAITGALTITYGTNVISVAIAGNGITFSP